MADNIQIIDSQEADDSFGDKETFALDILVGLSEARKSIPSQYLYDEQGSRLFQQITLLPEYYVTEAEKDVLREHAQTLAAKCAHESFNLVEFGAGDGSKAAILIEAMIKCGCNFRYVPIDISQAAMVELIENLEGQFPDLELKALVSEYFAGIKYLSTHSRRRNLVLFLGSSVGNFSHARACFFLRNVWNYLNNGDQLLTGFDLKKDIEMLLWAYNDPQGVTAEFNLNVLRRINRELGGRFDVSQFRHFGTYDVFSGAMESYLVSLEEQEVFIEAIGRAFQFRAWEPIHTEYSYKYLMADVETLAAETGFLVREHMTCERGYFLDSLWEVRKASSAADFWQI